MLYIKLVQSSDILKCEEQKLTHFKFVLGHAEVTSKVGKGFDEVSFEQELYLDDKTAGELWITVLDCESVNEKLVLVSTSIKLSSFGNIIYGWFDLFNRESQKQGQVLLVLSKNGRPATYLPKVTVGVSYYNPLILKKPRFANCDLQTKAKEWRSTKKMENLGKLGSWSPSF